MVASRFFSHSGSPILYVMEIVWVNSGAWWWTGRLGMLPFMGSQRVGHDWATGLNWTDGYSMSITLSLIKHVTCIITFHPQQLNMKSGTIIIPLSLMSVWVHEFLTTTLAWGVFEFTMSEPLLPVYSAGSARKCLLLKPRRFECWRST